ncbi:MAG: aldehyde dehydrogenase family protein [Candidatus Omnitrophica bacterium]|nr:aldehyde dehydrogenase family protein [Candidatus Omnitrophota bacterium]
MSSVYGSYINGAFRRTGVKDTIRDPATGEPVAEVARAGKQDVLDALSAARSAFDTGPWRGFGFSQRGECLNKIARGILENAALLAELETRNTGKPIKESTFMDIPSGARSFEFCARHLAEYCASSQVTVSEPFPARAELAREARGVCVLIVPWNYPLLIACWKLSNALAAGNTVVLKPSSLTPLTALELARIIDETGLPEGVVNVVAGSGAVLGETLCADKRVDMVSFTGSNSVGKQIIGYTRDAVKKTIMELGGKSASVIFGDADREAAVNASLCSIFLNQGQMCTAMSRILVEDVFYEDFLKDFVAKAGRITLGKGMDYQTQMGPLISGRQREGVLSFVKRAGEQGARILCGGRAPDEESLQQGFFFSPTVIVDVEETMEVYREEVFGPVAVVQRFCGMEEAVRLANSTDFALAACVWSGDRKRAQEVAARLDAGTVWINTYGMFLNELSYGGFKQSGFGKELGRDGMLEYTRLKTICADDTKNDKPLVHYWYGF